MRSRQMHAICPVRVFDAAAWKGWLIKSTEKVNAPAGVGAHVADHRTLRAFPARGVSAGEGWDVHHLVKPMDDGGSR